MKKAILGCALGIITLLATAAPELNDVPDRYTVKKGDTLWDISEHFLKTPWLWPEIWHVNPDVANPHLIYPGDMLKLIYVDGKPRIVKDSRNVKLSPKIRVLPHAEPIPALPLEAINHFLSRNRVVEPGVLEAAPYVVYGADKHTMSASGQNFYTRGELEPGIPKFGIYRKGDNYVDQVTGELLGVRAKDIGTGQLKAIDDKGISTFKATRSVEEIRIADRLLPHEERKINTVFYPKAPERDIDGVMINVEDGLTQVGRLDVVALNKGARDGLSEGSVLAIYKAGATVKDRVTNETVTLPAERAGLLMVFRTFEKMSYGLVMKAERALAVGDLVRNP